MRPPDPLAARGDLHIGRAPSAPRSTPCEKGDGRRAQRGNGVSDLKAADDLDSMREENALLDANAKEFYERWIATEDELDSVREERDEALRCVAIDEQQTFELLADCEAARGAEYDSRDLGTIRH